MNLIAHKGIHDNINIVENTMKAFTYCIEKNIPAELDVRLTKDNIPVVCHDDNLKRLAGLNKKISNLNYNQLKKIKLKDKSNIPLLKDVLKKIEGEIDLYIEIKDSNNYKLICEQIDKIIQNYKGIIYIKSFNYKIVKYFKNKNKESGLLITDNKKSKYYKNILLLKIIIKYLNPDFLSISKKLVNKKYYKKLIKKYKTLIWTIKNKDELKEINYSSNQYIICDNLINELNIKF